MVLEYDQMYSNYKIIHICVKSICNNFKISVYYALYDQEVGTHVKHQYRGADKFLARPISRCILFDGENISFDASLVLCIYIYIYIYIYSSSYDYK